MVLCMRENRRNENAISHPEEFDDERDPAPLISGKAMTLKSDSRVGFPDAMRRRWRDIIVGHPCSVVT